mmetsp:Transcript_25607/g.55548  ORF Transcript_25607/g.55548 Transcript_25607/m.55548 type:complete len:88 (+) Transcript_25607:438-701(+)
MTSQCFNVLNFRFRLFRFNLLVFKPELGLQENRVIRDLYGFELLFCTLALLMLTRTAKTFTGVSGSKELVPCFEEKSPCEAVSCLWK